MNLKILETALRHSWTKETCFPDWQSEWANKDPAHGQCVPTALVVNNYFGGDFIYDRKNQHVWNRLPNGKEVDLSRSQFPRDTIFSVSEYQTREQLLHSEKAVKYENEKRYNLLKEKVLKSLS